MFKLVVFLVISIPCVAELNCDVSDLEIGTPRDLVISQIKKQGCDLQLEESKDGFEDDLVLNPSDEKFAYYELIFEKGSLAAVWSHSPLYTSADKAFMALYDELIVHAEQPATKAHDYLGQRKLPATPFLMRPLTESVGLERIGFEVQNGIIYFERKKSKDGATCVKVTIVRNK